jgi:predicted DsbA family dithiol-disulfide isomerase
VLARDAGLDGDALTYTLKVDAYRQPLEHDLALAQAIGIRGVPAALVGPAHDDLVDFIRGAEPVVGAVPEDWMLEAVERARSR